MPQMDAALVAIAHPTADVSSMAGLPAQLITNALLGLALQLPFLKISESMGNHDSKIVGAGSVD
jgi:hypothetical protein